MDGSSINKNMSTFTLTSHIRRECDKTSKMKCNDNCKPLARVALNHEILAAIKRVKRYLQIAYTRRDDGVYGYAESRARGKHTASWRRVFRREASSGTPSRRANSRPDVAARDYMHT